MKGLGGAALGVCLVFAGGSVQAQSFKDWKALTTKAVEDVLNCYQLNIPKAVQQKTTANDFLELGHKLCKNERDVMQQISTTALKATGLPEAEISDRVDASMTQIDDHTRAFYQQQLDEAK